ncbi:MAG: SpoOJ/ParA/ParB/repB family protein [bacterium 42_11]|nr:MAG: SpoOJ/ParA/ParB/repB family protein [bacterium 42_11]
MAIVKPFKALRPRADLVQLVASLPYDVLSFHEAKKMVEGNPYSFLRVEKSEIEFSYEPGVDDIRVYKRARENLERMVKEGVLVEEGKPCFYIYREIAKGRVQTGIVGCCSIDDYLNNVIKKHEHTRADKELERIRHIETCDANTGPVFLFYPYSQEINRLTEGWIERHRPVYDFQSEDGVRHIVWIIDDEGLIKEIEEAFKKIDSLYIADGHHRCAAAVKVGLERRKEAPSFTGKEGFNYFLAVIFPDRDLYIMEYNRVVRDLNGLTEEEFLSKVGEKFLLEERGKTPYRPEREHFFGMYLGGKWYKLEAKKGTYDESDPVKSLDVYILQENLLGPILGISDPRTDRRTDFVGGIKGIEELKRRVDSGEMKVAFVLYPVSVKSLMAVSDAGMVMPPKSTWFEPKLRSGLFVHKLSEW